MVKSSSPKGSKSKDSGNGAIDTIINDGDFYTTSSINNEKHKRSRRTKKKSSSTTSKQKHPDHASKNSNDDADDDDNQSYSTASTFSYIQSILERRRHILKPLPTVHENDNSDEEGTAVGVFHHASSKRHHPTHSPHNNDHNRSKRKRKRKYNKSRIGPCHPLVLLTLIGLASNWVATRILSTILLEEIDLDQRSISNIMEMNRGGGGERRSRGKDSLLRSSSLGDSLGDLSMEGDTDSMPIRSIDSGHIRYEPLQQQYDGVLLSNDSRNRDKDSLVGRSGNDGSHSLLSSDQTKDALGEEYVDGQQNNGPHGIDGDASLATKRFANLRNRLLELYSEAVPPYMPSYNATNKLHPLFNAESPQYHALDWLANIDRLGLRHYDPGLVQRYVLAVLYFSTGGPKVNEDTDLSEKHKGPWRNPTMFLAPTHECEWKSRIIDGAGRGGGIRRCDKNKTVVEVSLYNELSGSIPSELGRLWNLRTLYLGRNHLTGTIPTELGMIQKLSSLSLQWNDLTGTIPQRHLKNLLTLRALQLEGNEKISGEIERHSLLCQMRNKYRGPTPRDQERYTGRRVLRMFTATCVPSSGSVGVSDRLECACCTECFGKTTKDLIY